MNKKFYYILVVIGLIVLFGVLYFAVAKDDKKFEDNLIIGLQENGQGNIYYFDRDKLAYFNKTGDADKQIFELGYEPFTMIYSPDRSKVLAIGSVDYPGKAIDLIDLIAKKKQTLDLRIINAGFSPDGTEVAYHYYDPKQGTSSIYTADSEFAESSKKLIANLDYAENLFYILRWVDSENLLILPMQSDDYNVELYKLNIYSKKLQTVTSGTFLDFIPTASKSKILIHGTVQNNNQTVERDLRTISVSDLSSNKTLKTRLVVDSLNSVTRSSNANTLYVVGTLNNVFGLYSLDLDGNVKFIKNIEQAVKDHIIEVVYSLTDKAVFISTEDEFIKIPL